MIIADLQEHRIVPTLYYHRAPRQRTRRKPAWLFYTYYNGYMAHTISARRVIITSFAVDFLDLVFNITVAIFTGSVVMLAEALQGGADLVTSGLLLIGLKQSKRRANRQFRFGYGRELFFWILMAGMTMFCVTAVFSVYFGLQRIFHPSAVTNIPLAFVILAIGLCTNLYAFQLSLRRLRAAVPASATWRQIVRSALVETKATLILDGMGSAAAAFGLLSLTLYHFTGNQIFDGVGAVIIGVFTGAAALLLIADVKTLLVGKGVEPATQKQIRQAVLSFPEVRSVLDLRTMYLGVDMLLINLEVHLAADMTTTDIEVLMDDIKAKVQREVPGTRHIQIEVETP
jgi:cation diffusion facilitator family transporter